VACRIVPAIEPASCGVPRHCRGSRNRHSEAPSCIVTACIRSSALTHLKFPVFVQAAGFKHAGMQCYAYVLARASVASFDWISLQLYESFSRFQHDTTRRNPPIPQAEAIFARAEAFSNGFWVHMPPPHAKEEMTSHNQQGSGTLMPVHMGDTWNHLKKFVKEVVWEIVGHYRHWLGLLPHLPTDYKVTTEHVAQPDRAQWVRLRVQVPVDKLVIGVANGWADGEKVCRVNPSELLKVRCLHIAYCLKAPQVLLQRRFQGDSYSRLAALYDFYY
jgi:hypothetical protein